MNKKKKCTKCGKVLFLENFNRDKSRKDGYSYLCKKCEAEKEYIYKEKNKKRTNIKIPIEKYCPTCKTTLPSKKFSRCKSRKDGLAQRCKKCAAEMQRVHGEKNKKRAVVEIPLEKYCSKCKRTLPSENFNKCKSRKDGLDGICKKCQQKYQKENKEQLRQRAYERIATDINVYLRTILRSRLNTAIRDNIKTGSAVKDLGCTIPEFKVHIEKQFTKGMSWGTYGLKGWHLDHIEPLASFDLTDRKQFLHACHYKNYQPLWAKDNLSKGAKLCLR